MQSMNRLPPSPASHRRLAMAVASAISVAIISPVQSQSAQNERPGAGRALLEEVMVTARKREEGSQDVPLQISAFGADQIEALKVRDLTNLAVGMPNVALDEVGTSRGTANFSIRGLGINSSIPSIDPTVGVFVNGIYLGTNNGIIFDVFDLESIEVLRGPQGILFGRNVTGGAILMNTKRPGEEFEGEVRVAVDGGGDGGMNRYIMGSVGGPVSDTLGLRLTGYLNDDDGWHENLFDGGDVQAVEQKMLRGTAVWTPADRLELTAIFETSEIDGDGPVPQSHVNGSGVPGFPVSSDPDTFEANYDEVGSQLNETDFLTLQLNYDLDFGDGTVTALYGYRDNESSTLSDIDAQPVPMFHAPADFTGEQQSFELRYNGQFGNANVTVGGFWFDNDIAYHERRDLLGALTPLASGGALGSDIPFQVQDGGGLYTVETQAVFANVDYDVTERLTLSIGARWTDETKSADIATIALNTNQLDIPNTIASGSPVYVNPFTGTDTRCNIVLAGDCTLDYSDSNSWETMAPKVGFSYALSDASQIYGFAGTAFRSGGYNLRNTSTNRIPRFNEERVDSWEFGYKSQQPWGRVNAAVFRTEIDEMQREVNLPDEDVGVVQIIANTADATIMGLEVDAAIPLGESLLLLASVGYLDASYDSVKFDLSGDGVAGRDDLALDLPRAPELTYSIGLTYDWDMGSWGYASARLNYAYRDEVAYTDNNLGIIPEQDIVDAGLDFYSSDNRWVLSLYGRNLLDTVKWGNDTQLPNSLGPLPLGGTFSPLAKGRVYGAQVTYSF